MNMIKYCIVITIPPPQLEVVLNHDMTQN